MNPSNTEQLTEKAEKIVAAMTERMDFLLEQEAASTKTLEVIPEDLRVALVFLEELLSEVSPDVASLALAKTLRRTEWDNARFVDRFSALLLTTGRQNMMWRPSIAELQEQFGIKPRDAQKT